MLEAEKLASKLNVNGCSYVYIYQFDDDNGFIATAIVLANENNKIKDYALVVKGEDYDNEELFNEDDFLTEITEDNPLFKELEKLFFNLGQEFHIACLGDELTINLDIR